MHDDNNAHTERRTWKAALAEEFRDYLFNFAFLSFFLISFAWYRWLILAEYHLEDLRYLMPIVEAAILAKIIMIGDMLRVGRELRGWPLIVPTIYRTVLFSLLVAAFSVVEHIVRALLHGKPASAGITELTSKGWNEMLAWCVLIVVAFLPFFTVKELERAFGRQKIRGMFFRRQSPPPAR